MKLTYKICNAAQSTSHSQTEHHQQIEMVVYNYDLQWLRLHYQLLLHFQDYILYFPPKIWLICLIDAGMRHVFYK